MMDSHVIHGQSELLERESAAERDLLQAQERVKAIRTMRRRVLAMIGNQGGTPVGTPARKIRMSPNASALASPVLTAAKGLPDAKGPPGEHEEVTSPKMRASMLSNTLPGIGYSCSEPEITLVMTAEARPQSVPTDHHFINTTSYNHDRPFHPASDTAPGYLTSPHSRSPDTTLTTCPSKPLPEALQVNETLDHYTGRPSLPRSWNNLSVEVLFRGIHAHMRRDTTSSEAHIIPPRSFKRRQ